MSRVSGLRNGQYYCAYTWSEPTWNPIGHNYGTTTENWTSVNHIRSDQPAHTLYGWTSDNQTDG